jgi:hypothetical protein
MAEHPHFFPGLVAEWRAGDECGPQRYLLRRVTWAAEHVRADILRMVHTR